MACSACLGGEVCFWKVLPALEGLAFLGAFLMGMSVPVVWNFLKSCLLFAASTHSIILEETESKLGQRPDMSLENTSFKR